jgi:hypothetical protein
MIGNKAIGKGSSEKRLVSLIQKELQKAGHSITVDGDFGEKTALEVKKYQQEMHLEPTGIVSEKTWFCLLEDYDELDFRANPNVRWAYEPITTPVHKGKLSDKNIAFLHHTASGPDAMRIDDYFSDKGYGTTFSIGGDGLILQMCSLADWMYHINMTADFKFGKNGSADQQHEDDLAKRSIGIEICCWGALDEKNGKLYNYTGGEMNPTNCIDYEQVYGQGWNFRGYRYFEKYTPQAIEATKQLLKALKAKGLWKKDKSVVIDERWSDYSYDATRGKRSLMSHSQVRAKTDIHPQPEMLKMLNEL